MLTQGHAKAPKHGPTNFAKKVLDHIISKDAPEAAESLAVQDRVIEGKRVKNPAAVALGKLGG